MLGLLALSGAASLLIARYRFPNVFVIAPLLVTAALTGSGVEWSVMPAWLVNVGQLALGVSMGSRFTPEFLRSAPRFLACVVVSLLVMLALAAGYGYVFGLLSGVNPATTILATAPGGVTEMALTAKVLQLGVSMVTVFQVSRMMLLVLLAGPAFRLYKPWFVKPVTPTLP
jgi:membrane AbrB-like protein